MVTTEKKPEQTTGGGRRAYHHPVLTPRGRMRHITEGFDLVVTDGRPVGAG